MLVLSTGWTVRQPETGIAAPSMKAIMPPMAPSPAFRTKEKSAESPSSTKNILNFIAEAKTSSKIYQKIKRENRFFIL